MTSDSSDPAGRGRRRPGKGVKGRRGKPTSKSASGGSDAGVDVDPHALCPLPPSRRSRLTALWCLLVFCTAFRTFLLGTEREVERQRQQDRPPAIQLNLHTASLGELALLPGIGPVRARSIILHRLRHGPLQTVLDLTDIAGIGPLTVRSLLPHVRI